MAAQTTASKAKAIAAALVQKFTLGGAVVAAPDACAAKLAALLEAGGDELTLIMDFDRPPAERWYLFVLASASPSRDRHQHASAAKISRNGLRLAELGRRRYDHERGLDVRARRPPARHVEGLPRHRARGPRRELCS